jgi:hypothetical protein
MDKKIKSFEELELDEEKLSRSISDHQREVEARREIDLDYIRKVLKFYKVRLEEIAEHLDQSPPGANQSSGSDYWSNRK